MQHLVWIYRHKPLYDLYWGSFSWNTQKHLVIRLRYNWWHRCFTSDTDVSLDWWLSTKNNLMVKNAFILVIEFGYTWRQLRHLDYYSMLVVFRIWKTLFCTIIQTDFFFLYLDRSSYSCLSENGKATLSLNSVLVGTGRFLDNYSVYMLDTVASYDESLSVESKGTKHEFENACSGTL